VCDEHGIGGDGEYCGDNDSKLDRTNVLYYEASGGKYAPFAVFFDLEPGVIDAARALPLGELIRPGNLVGHARGKNGPKTTTEGLTPFSNPPIHKCQTPMLITPPRVVVQRLLK
jgi:hypothetical protein